MNIALDYDGTIADTNRLKADWIKEKLGKTIEPRLCNRTDCIPLIGEEAYIRLGNYVYEEEGTRRAEPVEGALSAIKILATRHSLYIITARPEARLQYARDWLKTHGIDNLFQGIFTSVGTTKPELCHSLNIAVLVDDDYRHVGRLKPDSGLLGLHLQIDSALLDENTCRSWQDVLTRIGI